MMPPQKLKERFLLVSAAYLLVVLSPSPTRAGEWKMWYRHPAQDWEEALPVGNGRLGGMVFGEIHRERISLNEESIWSGKTQPRIANNVHQEVLRKKQKLL